MKTILKTTTLAVITAYMDLTDLPISNSDNQSKERVEIDFLVFYKQKCMILEVDGVHHQEASQKTRDYRRDRVLLRDGIRTVRFDAGECFNRPMDVVTEFLNLF
jgi:very-short-patch-repair endonuclease